MTIVRAKEWLNSGNKQLQELALQVFDIDELASDFRCIKTFEDACKVLGYKYSYSYMDKINRILSISTSAMFRLNIIRQALNFGQNMQLAKNPKDSSHIYHPFNPLVIKGCEREFDPNIVEIIGEIRTGGVSYYVLNGIAYFSSIKGLGDFNYSIRPGNYSIGSGSADANSGFLGCATKEIAQHFGKYFGMLITTAKYADVIKDFEIIKSKYII